MCYGLTTAGNQAPPRLSLITPGGMGEKIGRLKWENLWIEKKTV